MYLSFARLFCEINIISQEISRAESEYMQPPPLPPSMHHSATGLVHKNHVPGKISLFIFCYYFY